MNFSATLMEWYSIHKRDLPWRNTSNPYLIWLSEIIFQQTRIAQGMDYYLAFANRFPELEILANSKEAEVLKLWQGLGYYSRARNMHHAARTIYFSLGGKFPENYNELLKIKGIGPYSAAAIASFAYNEPVAVVDGNVYRVLSRVFGISIPIDTSKGAKIINEIASGLLDHTAAGIYNQSIMEFGAVQCVPKNPDCEICPFRDFCSAYSSKMVSELPVKSKKTGIRNRYFNYLVVIDETSVLVHQRVAGDIWQGLYEFPLLETPLGIDIDELLLTESFFLFFKDVPYELKSCSEVYIHQLSHQRIHARFICIVINSKGMSVLEKNFEKVLFSKFKQLPISRLIENFVNKIDFLSANYSDR